MDTIHDSKVVSIFEIIGSFVVDTFFNHVYTNAKNNVGTNSTLVDEYIKRIQLYVLGIKDNKKYYEKVVNGMLKYFTQTTKYVSLTYPEFVDKIVITCIPVEYFRQLTNQDKDEIFASIITDLISSLATFVTRPEILRKIVDEHDKSSLATIRLLQDNSVNILTTKRISLINKFIKTSSQGRDNISTDAIDELRKINKKLCEKINEYEEAIEEMNDREENYKKLISLLKEKITQSVVKEVIPLPLPQVKEVIPLPQVKEVIPLPQVKETVPIINKQPEKISLQNFFKPTKSLIDQIDNVQDDDDS